MPRLSRSRRALAIIAILVVVLILHEGWQRMEGRSNDDSIDQRLLDVNVFHSSLRCKCSTEKRAIFIVHSATANKIKRESIRQTYGSEENQAEYSFCLFFITGRPRDPTEEKGLVEESSKFKDILIGDFEDAYSNMTIKALFWMRFVAKQCSPTQTIVKLDDDVAINLRLLSHRLSSIRSHSIYGIRWTGMPVLRKNTSKWYVPFSLYAFESFPPYVSGNAYLLTVPTVQELLGRVPYHPLYTHVDDAYVTGILANSAGVRIVDRSKWWDIGSNATEALRRGEVLFALHNSKVDLVQLYKDVSQLSTHRLAVYPAFNHD